MFQPPRQDISPEDKSWLTMFPVLCMFICFWSLPTKNNMYTYLWTSERLSCEFKPFIKNIDSGKYTVNPTWSFPNGITF